MLQCVECHKMFSESEVIMFGERPICASCQEDFRQKTGIDVGLLACVSPQVRVPRGYRGGEAGAEKRPWWKFW